MRSLVIDDEFVARSKVRAVVARHGETDTATSGAQALACFQEALRRRCPYDLVTIDINLPDASGLSLLRDFANLERLAGVAPAKKIMISADGTTGAVAYASVFRCDDFIVKPFSRELLEQKLRELGFDLRP